MANFKQSAGSLARERAAAEQLAHDLAQPRGAFIDGMQEHLSMAGTATLVGFLRTGIDARAVLGKVLADRGLDQSGQWVGFEAAEIAFQQAFPASFEEFI